MNTDYMLVYCDKRVHIPAKYLNDTLTLTNAVKVHLGLTINPVEMYKVWAAYSNDCCASWLIPEYILDGDDVEVNDALYQLIEDYTLSVEVIE